MFKSLFFILIFTANLYSDVPTPKKMNSLIIKEACKKDAYFVECFNIDVYQCKTYMRHASDWCLKQIKELVTSKKIPDDNFTIIKVNSQCMLSTYEGAFKKLNKHNEKCLNLPKWKKEIK